MKKNSLSKTAEVIAFLKENSEDISIQEISKANNRSLRRREKILKGKTRKAS
jgi:hypothetical protein